MIVNDINVTIDSKNILHNISFVITSKDKIGLIGSNGVGKTTLLKTLFGDILPDKGSINLENKSIGYLKQEIPTKYKDNTILEYIKDDTGISKLEDHLQQLEKNLNDNNMNEYGDALNKYLEINGYNLDSNLKVIISGLNLKESLDTPISNLSGGEKIKVLLAELLLENKDILLLDEPTNNLDKSAIDWLKNYLQSSMSAIIVVSHDEDFLTNVVNTIYELKDGLLKQYHMTYDKYLVVKSDEYNQALEEHNKMLEEKNRLQKQLAQAKEWANKGNNKKAHNDNDKIANNFAREHTNNANISKLAKNLNNLKITEFEEKKPINFFFNFDDSKGNKDVICNDLICGYDNFHTTKINLNVDFGEKIEVIGDNGSGKTTFVKTLLGEIKPISGKINLGSGTKIGYISQETIFDNSDTTIFDYLTHGVNTIDSAYLFTLLDKFNISYDDRNKKYNTLSPGERTRISLAKMALDKTNILILDEVTNHLDIEALNLVYELVNTYNGTIISISHNKKYNDVLNADAKLDINSGVIEYNNKKLIKQ